MQQTMVCSWQRLTGLNDLLQGRTKSVITIGSVEAMIPVRPTFDQPDCLKLAQFVLNGVER